MENNITILKKELIKIKEKGWIPLDGKSVGSKLEELLDIRSNQLYFPDYYGIEIKAHNIYNHRPITFFNLTPKPDVQTKYLFEHYNYCPKGETARFYADFYLNIKSPIGIKYSGELRVTDKKLYLLIYDIYGNMIDDSTYWDLDELNERFNNKCNIICYINAKKKRIKNNEYVFYDTFKICRAKNKKSFENALRNGNIIVNMKIDLFKSGQRSGQLHDHGTAFRIDAKNFGYVFDFYFIK